MLERDTYKDKVKKYIIDLILNHKLVPGDQIKEKDLSQTLGISRAPIREAFKELIAEQILEYIPFKGTYFKKTSSKEALNIYITRGLLEGYAVAESISSNLKNQDQLNHLVEEMYVSAKRQDNIQLIELGDQFHNLLFKGCSNNIILSETKRFGLLCHLLFLSFWPKIYTPSQIRDRHRKIIEVLKSKDRANIESVIRDHYFETGKRISLIIERGDYE